MTQPEVSMTPEEVLALIDDATEHSKIDMCADIAVSELREIRAAVAELRWSSGGRYFRLFRGLCVSRMSYAARLLQPMISA